MITLQSFVEEALDNSFEIDENAYNEAYDEFLSELNEEDAETARALRESFKRRFRNSARKLGNASKNGIRNIAGHAKKHIHSLWKDNHMKRARDDDY